MVLTLLKTDSFKNYCQSSTHPVFCVGYCSFRFLGPEQCLNTIVLPSVALMTHSVDGIFC